MSNLTIADALNHASYFFSENSEIFHGAFDQASRVVARGVESFAAAARNGVEFQGDDEITTACKKVWGLIENSKVLSNDATVDVVKKSAFAFFVTVPIGFMIKDTIKTTTLDLSAVKTMGEGLGVIFKTFVYTSAILIALNLLTSVLSDSPQPDSQPKPKVKTD